MLNTSPLKNDDLVPAGVAGIELLLWRYRHALLLVSCTHQRT